MALTKTIPTVLASIRVVFEAPVQRVLMVSTTQILPSMFIVNETYVVFKTLEFIFLGSSHSNETRNAIEDTHVGHTLNKKVWAHTLWKNTLCIPNFFWTQP